MAKLKSLFKDSMIYGVGNALRKVIGLFLVPIFTRVLTPEEYGISSTLATLTFFISTIGGLGLIGATNRYFFKAENEEEKGKVLSTSLFLLLASTGCITIIALIFSRQISMLLFETDKWKLVVAISLLLIPINSISGFLESIFRFYRVAWKYLIVTVTRATVSPGLAILLVVIIPLGVLGVKLAAFLSAVVTMCLAYFLYAKKKINWKFDRVWSRQLLIFGFPLIWTGVLTWVNSVSDKLLILKLDSLSAVGLYSIGQSFSQPVLFVSVAIEMGSAVLIMSLYHKDQDPEKTQTKQTITQYWYTYLLISIPICSFLSIFGYDILRIITTEDYVKSAIVVPFLAMGYVMDQSMNLTGVGMNLKENTKPYIWIMLIAATSNILLNFILIPRIGFLGAGIATLLSNYINFQVAYSWSQRYFYIERNLVPIYLYWVLTLSICLIFPYLSIYENLHLSIWIKIIVFIFSLSLPLITGFITYPQMKILLINAYKKKARKC